MWINALIKKNKTTLNLRNEMWKYLVFFNYSAGPDYRRRVRVTDGKDDSIRHLNKRHTGLNRSFKIILFVHPVVVTVWQLPLLLCP